MQHCDPDELALRALGEDVGSPETDAHLAACAQCRREVEEFRVVVRAARSGSGDDTPEAPPPRVWESVREELGLTAAEAPQDADETAVVDLGRARHRRRPSRFAPAMLAAAAAVGVLAGGAGVWALTGTDRGPATEVLASTELEPLPSWDARGTATVEGTADGSRTLVVDVPAAGSGEHDGYHEVWLLDPDVSQLVSLGVLEGPTGTFAIPAGLDLAELPVVDISLEPYDGDPTHSGDSVVRGTLEG